MHGTWLKGQHDLVRATHELRGKDIVCFGPPQACSAGLLLSPADGTREDMARLNPTTFQ